MLRRLLAENPKMVYGWQQLGRALEDSGDLAGGLKAYQRALSLSPEIPDPFSLAGAGRLLLLLGRYQGRAPTPRRHSPSIPPWATSCSPPPPSPTATWRSPSARPARRRRRVEIPPTRW
jgi:hypothetical protein